LYKGSRINTLLEKFGLAVYTVSPFFVYTIFMIIDDDTARRLASISSIDLDDDEFVKIKAKMDEMADSISLLDELNTDGVEPTFQLVELSNVWREDIVEKQLPREEFLKMAPERTDMAVKVPKVL